MSVDGNTLETDIVSEYLDNIESSTDVSGETVNVLNDMSSDADFGGRDELKDRLLEAKGIDED